MKKIALLSILLTFSPLVNAEVFFNGFSGAKTDFNTSARKGEVTKPQLTLQSFFACQLNPFKNVIIHSEFSLTTEDFMQNSLFKETPATFQVDEVSITFRRSMTDVSNYFSCFMGTYEPLGSDIFLQRQFGIKPITSKITESWLGLKGSVIYPHFGVGISDVIHFQNAPIALGLYGYINREIENTNIFNSDLRFACIFKDFTFDIAGGVGIPMESDDKEDEDAFLVIRKMYSRAAMNLLLGNRYYTSLFIQAGFSEVPFTKKSSISIGRDSTYILFEPRIVNKMLHVDLTFFSLPEDSVKNFFFIDDTLGINADFYTNDLYINNKTVTFGFNTTLSFKDRSIYDIEDIGDFYKDYNINVAPFIQYSLFTGELHAMIQLHITDMVNDSWKKCATINVGYKTRL